MRIPSLTPRRSASAVTHDSDGDGRADQPGGAVATDTGTRPDARPVATDRGGERTTYRSSTADGAAAGRAADLDRRRAADRPVPADRTTIDRAGGVRADPDRADAATAGTERAAGGPTGADRATPGAPADGETRREPERVAVGPKPRASLLATVGLVVAVAGALAVLTGTLAGYGIAVGALGAVLAAFGLVATRRRHIAGKTDALLGMAFGVVAVVLGVLAMTGRFDWPTTDGDWVQRLREWLDSQFAARF
jgi:hypothetical protein